MYINGEISTAKSAKQLMKAVMATKNGIMPDKGKLKGISTAISPEGEKSWVKATKAKNHKKDGPTR